MRFTIGESAGVNFSREVQRSEEECSGGHEKVLVGVESGTPASGWHGAKRPFRGADTARMSEFLRADFCDGNSCENSAPPILT